MDFQKKIWEWTGWQVSSITPAGNPFQRYALAYYLANQIKQNRIVCNTQVIDLNLTGTNDSIRLPVREFSHRNKTFTFSKVKKGQSSHEDLTVYLLKGDNPDTYEFEIWSKDIKRVIEEIESIYDNLFYGEKNPLFPVFFYQNNWILSPRRLIGDPVLTVNKERQEQVLIFINENREGITNNRVRGLLFSGPAGSGKTSLSYLIGRVLRRKIFIMNNQMRRGDFLNSILKIPSKSILSISDIDRVFFLDNPDGIQRDMLTSLFDNLQSDVLVLISTNDAETLIQIYGLTQNVGRIFKHFQF